MSDAGDLFFNEAGHDIHLEWVIADTVAQSYYIGKTG